MDLSNYKYIAEIQGVALVDIVLRNNKGEVPIKEIKANFVIDLKKSEFEIRPDETSLKSLRLHYFRSPHILTGNIGKKQKSVVKSYYPDKFKYIHGIDSNKIPFTLLDCCFYPLNMPETKFNIVWNNIIIGQHIEDEDSCFVDRVKCVLEDTTGKYRYSVEGNTYNIMADKITVKTYIGTLRDEENNKTYLKDIVELTSTDPISLKEIKEHFYSLLGMYSLFVGCIPEIVDMRFFCGESTEFVYATYHDILFSSNNKGRLEKCLLLTDSQNFSAAYEKWNGFTQKNPFVFNMFRFALGGRDSFMETRAVLFIQCLEGYFTTHHEHEISRKEKSKFNKQRKPFSK